jgi:hypothetical protein
MPIKGCKGVRFFEVWGSGLSIIKAFMNEGNEFKHHLELEVMQEGVVGDVEWRC